MRSLGMLGAALASLIVFGACCCSSMPVGQLSSTPLANSLDKWSGFPATQLPRPIVLYSSIELAFQTDAHNVAFQCHKFEVSGSLSTDSPGQTTITWPDGTSASYPVLSESDMFRIMTAPPVPPLQPPYCDTPKSLSVTAMRFGTAQFDTDRGTVQIPAWTATIIDAYRPIVYPAIPPSAFWAGGISETKSPDELAYVSADGRSLTLSFTGTQADGPCGNSYNGLVAESSSAVELTIQRIPNGTPSESSCNGDHKRLVAVELQSPLGGRVVISEAGYWIIVCPDKVKPGTRC